MDLRTTLVETKGKWYVCLTIPLELRVNFKNRKQLKVSTGTSDKSLAKARFITKSQELINKVQMAAVNDHPLVKAAEQVFEITSYVASDYSPSELLNRDTFNDVVADVKARKTFLSQIEWMGSGDPETAYLVASDREKMEAAMTEFEEQLSRYSNENLNGLVAFSEKPKLSEVLKEWMSVEKFNRLKTRDTYLSQVNRLIKFLGDIPVDEVTKVDANKFVRSMEQEGYAHSTIETAVAGNRRLLNYAEEIGLVDRNVFSEVRLKGRGKAKVQRSTFSKSQLNALLSLKMKERDRLCLTILAVTGMRLDEVALLRFEDIKQEVETGIGYFDLTGGDKIVKNDQSSRRLVPIPDVLQLPYGGEGRIFDYRTDADGKAENAASKALMNHVKQVRRFEGENLVVHSLRHTYKDMLRDAGVARDLQEFLMGHAASSVGDTYGQGFSLKAKKEAIDMLDFSFIPQ